MKILITNSFYPPFHIGGACVHSKYLAEALVEQGHKVYVLTSIDAYNLKRREKRIVDSDNGVIVHRLKSPLGKLEPIFNYTFETQKYT